MNKVDVAEFIEVVKYEGILDPEGVHHEFVDGDHGQKLHGEVFEQNPDTFADWVTLNAQQIREAGMGRAPVLSVANGTNNLVRALGKHEHLDVPGLTTTKDHRGIITLSHLAVEVLVSICPSRLSIVDDIGTTGSQVLKVAGLVTELAETHSFEPPRFEAFYTWQRTPVLKHLVNADIPAHVLHKEVLPTFSAVDCQRNPDGFCARGWKLVAHGAKKETDF